MPGAVCQPDSSAVSAAWQGIQHCKGTFCWGQMEREQHNTLKQRSANECYNFKLRKREQEVARM